MKRFTQLLLALCGLWLPSQLAAQYPYSHVPRILYVVGQPSWDQLQPDASGSRNLRVYADEQLARGRAGGAPIFRIQRGSLARTPEGEAFLKAVEAERADRTKAQRDVFELPTTSAESFGNTVVKNAKTGSELGPVNPNWHLTGPYQTKEMLTKYRPGQPDDDYGRGTFYFPTEGEAAGFMNNYKVSFQHQPDGSVRLMRPNPAGGMMPVHTLDLDDATVNVGGEFHPSNNGGLMVGGQDLQACLWVMDAEGNFFVVGRKWLIGIGDLGLAGINPQSLRSGHPAC